MLGQERGRWAAPTPLLLIGYTWQLKILATTLTFGTGTVSALERDLCERFEPRSHFISKLSMIVRVNVVLNWTVVVDSYWGFDNLCVSHLQNQTELFRVSWWCWTLVIDLIGQLSRDVIGRLSVKPSCFWLWRLVLSLVHFDPSIVTVKQSFIVSQIVSCPQQSFSRS